MPKPVVDQELCIGCTNCTSVCPDVFRMDDEHRSEVHNPEGCSNCDCQKAIDEYPVEAISLEE